MSLYQAKIKELSPPAIRVTSKGTCGLRTGRSTN